VPDWLRHLATRIGEAGKSGGLWLGIGVSVGLALVSLAIAVAVVVGWPADRFRPQGGAPLWASSHPLVRALGHAGKNLAGVVLLLLGFVMALPGVPGQGILTMIIGLTLVDFPGKVALERRLVSRPFVLRQLNALRRRFHRPPLTLDDAATGAVPPPRAP
jgi:hypothetical protein